MANLGCGLEQAINDGAGSVLGSSRPYRTTTVMCVMCFMPEEKITRRGREGKPLRVLGYFVLKMQ